MIDLRIFRRLSSSRMPLAALALSFCLAGLDGSSVWADGGNGGSTFPDANGGTGGAGTGGNAGSAGTAGVNGGGGGGGGAAGGGAGGTGFATGAGGAGGTSGSPDGQAGASGSAGGNNGGGGGGGGFNGTESAIPLANTGLITGGNGGSGGNGAQSTGVSGGGGGGAGGYGAVVSSGGTSVNSGSITGGTGGKGGTGNLGFFIFGASGNGGDGGVGLQFTTPGATFKNIGATPGTAAVTGGNGGAGGDDFGIGPGSTGLGGQGIVGSDLTVVTNGLISGGLSGDGATRSNAITFTGGVNILEIQPGYQFTGNVVANSAADLLRLGGTGTATFNLDDLAPGQAFQNFGNLEKTGSGTWTLIGTSTYTGDTTIQAGRLAINGSTTSNTTVDATGELGGTGTINGDLINNGIVAAGNSIGTLSVNGNFTHGANATMQVEIDAAGHSDLVDVTGTSTINGGHVQVLAAPGVYISGQQFIFLSSSSGYTGTFTSISDDLAMFDAQLVYLAHDVGFQLVLVSPTFSSLARNQIQSAVGAYLDGTGGDPNFPAISSNFLYLTSDQAANGLQQLGGEIYATSPQVMFQNTTLAWQNIAGRLRPQFGTSAYAEDVAAARRTSPQLVSFNNAKSDLPLQWINDCDCPVQSSRTGWALGYGLGGTASGNGNANGVSYGLGGTQVGLENNVDEYTTVGLYGGYVGSQVNTRTVSQQSLTNSGQVGGYLRRSIDCDYYILGGGFSFDDYASTRQLNIGPLNSTLSGNYNGWQGIAYAERGRTFNAGNYELQPYVAGQYIHLRQNGFSETGGFGALDVGGIDADSLRSFVGGRVSRPWVTRSGQLLIPQLRASWLHEFLDTNQVANARIGAFGTGTTFAVEGLDLGRDWALLGGSVAWEINDRLTISGNYDLQTNDRQSFHIGSGSLTYAW